jgi:hypothetical protein
LVLLGIVTLVLASAAGVPFDELEQRRKEHKQAVISATRMLDDVYRLTLRRIERDRADRGDYDGAKRARDRVEAVLPESDQEAALPTVRFLPASQARTQGVGFDRGSDVLVFRKPGAAAIWEVLGIVRGHYEVVAVYSVGPPENRIRNETTEVAPCGGTFTWKIATRLGESSPVLEKKVTCTGSWDNFIRATIGQWHFANRSSSVRIDAIQVNPGGLMNLKRIELRPLPPATGTKKAADRLVELRRDNRDALDSATAPAREKHRTRLEALERELGQQGDKAGADAVKAERTRLFPPAENKATPP